MEKSIVTSAPSDNIVAQALHPIKNNLEIQAVKMRKINPQKYIYDLGRNISGVSRIKVKGKPEQYSRLPIQNCWMIEVNSTSPIL